MFHIAKAVLCLYVVMRFVLPLPWPRPIKVGLSLILMVVFQHSLITLLVFGSMFSPEVPRIVMIAVNWLAGSILLLVAFQLFADLCALVLFLTRRHRVMIPTSVRYPYGAAALLVAAYGVSQAIRIPPTKEIEIAIPGLPAEFDGYRVIQLTDLHISRLFEAPWVDAVVERTNVLKPDLIVITGDLIDGTLQARERDVAPLSKLRAVDGVFTIPGNHEYYFGRDDWMQKYEELGLTTLANSHVVLFRDSSQLVLAGVNDLTADNFQMEGPDIGKAIAGAPTSAPVILLDHQPKEARAAADVGVALQLSGHTHGGMIKGFDRFIASYNNGFVSGLYQLDGMQLYVNNGTALWIGFAMRLGVPSELTVITLRRPS
ncbi:MULTISPECIES: metallophosphoesterase [Agrobacterium]|nr:MULTISPECIES: metallophosphoesterase [Agrobacterium]MBN7807824.1 metallophosphoesterase [Agrobacterium rosae]OCJ44882.1 metallophosphoesterase [Agrobacterium rubi]